MMCLPMLRRVLTTAPALLLLLFCAGGPARADYLTTTGAVQIIAPPASLQVGALTSDTQIRTFVENQRLTLTGAVSVDDVASGTFNGTNPLVGGTVAAGTSVDSYFFHSDPVNANQKYSGSVTFTTAVLGVIVLSNTLDATDSTLGHKGTSYPTGVNGRGLELSSSEDSFTLSADRRTLNFSFFTHNNVDEVRVITAASAVPEPGSMALLGLGTMILGGAAARRRRMARVG